MRSSIILSACAAIASLVAVNIATAAIRKQENKVLILPSAANVPTDDPDVPLNYLLIDDMPTTDSDDDLRHLTDIYGVIGENVDGQFLSVCETSGILDPTQMAATVAEDILARHRAGVNRNFRIIATGLFAQIALDVQRMIAKAHDTDPTSLKVNPKLVLIHPLLGWEQYRTSAEHESDLHRLRILTFGEVLLGNLAFLEDDWCESIASKRAILALEAESIAGYGRKLMSSNAAVIYDAANDYFDSPRFTALVEYDDVNLSFIDIRRRDEPKPLSNLELVGKALREVCQPSNPDVTS